MIRFRLLSIVLALASLAVLAMVWAPEPAVAQGPPGGLGVNVVNTPLPVTGSVTVAPGTSVQIDNTVADPVRVRNVNDAIQPVQESTNCDLPASTIGCGPTTIYTVPAGKRLVIEYASLNAFCILPGESVVLSIFTSTGGGASVAHVANIAPPAPGPGTTAIGCNAPAASSLTSVGQQVRLYADAGTVVQVEPDRNSNSGAANVAITISGYLVDVPLTP